MLAGKIGHHLEKVFLKVKTDDELSVLHKHTFGVAAMLGEKAGETMIQIFTKWFVEDEMFGHLDYSGAMSTILKANTIAFVRVLQFADRVGLAIPDCEHNGQELFEEAIEGLRYLTKFKEPNKKEYINGIKKVKVQ